MRNGWYSKNTMKEIGINSEALQEILAGRKTVETRLATPRFVAFRPGDEISLREDLRRDGLVVSSTSGVARIIVTSVDRFPSFREMAEALGVERINPTARNIDEALRRFRKFYTVESEAREGVVAISFSLVK